MKRIFVSGASGIVGFGVLKSLRMGNQENWLIGSSNKLESPANFFSDQFELAPNTSDEDYLDWLLETFTKHEIDLAIPGIDADLRLWFANRETIRSSGTKPLLNSDLLTQLSFDKWHMYEHLLTSKEPTLIPSSLSQDYDEIESLFGSDIIVKPRAGFGSKGFQKIQSRSDFNEVRGRIGSELLVQPLVGASEDEFTIGAYGDGKGGYTDMIAMRRFLSPEGFTQSAEVVDTGPFVETISRLCKNFNALGPTNFQFRMENQSLYLLEINPRISSSTSLRAKFGFNEAQMAVDHILLGKLPTKQNVSRGRAIRYPEDLIFLDTKLDSSIESLPT